MDWRKLGKAFFSVCTILGVVIGLLITNTNAAMYAGLWWFCVVLAAFTVAFLTWLEY